MTGWHWLFGGEVYYPSGGMNDLLGIYPTLDAAKAAATEAVQSERVEWWQIEERHDVLTGDGGDECMEGSFEE